MHYTIYVCYLRGVSGGAVRVGRIVGVVVVVTNMTLPCPLDSSDASAGASDASVNVSPYYQRTYNEPARAPFQAQKPPFQASTHPFQASTHPIHSPEGFDSLPSEASI